MALHRDFIQIPPDQETRRAFLPHDPGDQNHGSLVEGVEELDEDLSFLSQLPQSHAKHDGKHYQTKNIHAILVHSKRHLETRMENTVRTHRSTPVFTLET